MDWLNIPFELFNSYAVMLPVLEAKEQLARIAEIGVGTASMKETDRKKIMLELEQQASRKQKPKESMTAKLIQLSAMGIAVVDMRKKKT